METTARGWRIEGDAIVLELDRRTGCPSGLTIKHNKAYEWTRLPGDVTVRDDLLGRTFGCRDLSRVVGRLAGGVLRIEKTFKGAPWRLVEAYRVDRGCI